MASRDRRSSAQPLPVMVRQGDVLLIPVTEVPAAATAQARTGRIVLAAGEATGHAHAVLERDARMFTTDDGNRYLLAKSRAQLIHEEHAPIAIAPGAYQVVIQREFVPPRPDPPRQPRRRPAGSPWAWREVRD